MDTVTIKYNQEELSDQITSKTLLISLMEELPVKGLLKERLIKLVNAEKDILRQLKSKKLDDFDPDESLYQKQQEQCKSGVCD